MPAKDNLFNTYVDTTKYEGKVSYRIFGRNSFGQVSKPSDTLTIDRLPKFKAPIPQIDTIYHTKAGANIIKWSASGDTEYIKASFLEKSTQSEGNYELVEVDSVNQDFNFKDYNPNSKKYYRIGISTGNRISYSYPDIFQLIDSIPPATPSFKEYNVEDSLLIISWSANQEEDIAGYRLYKAQTLNAEPSLVYDAKKLDTTLTLSENLELINNERYFYIAAFDLNGNTSDLSTAFEVELPDIIPPSAPIIQGINQSNDSLKIQFVISSSEDVYQYLLYRSIDNALYELIKSFNPDGSSIVDLVEQEGLYKYRLIALDDSGNEGISKPYSYRVLLKKSSKIEYQIIENEESFQIVWDKKSNNSVRKVKIYYQTEQYLNLIREVSINEGILEIDKGSKLLENFKVIFI
ncbi:hypothetical protein ABWH96_19105 [Marivirga tractuosa]|uniref:fibronectin type III domain-containing protein n=1 Tax=Marivirga tractuosa TaxID=1006 RepID=UPI0035CFA290